MTDRPDDPFADWDSSPPGLAEALAAFGADRAEGAQQVLEALAGLHPEAKTCLNYLASQFYLHEFLGKRYGYRQRRRHGNSKPLEQDLREAEIAAAIGEYAATGTGMSLQGAANAVAGAAGCEPKVLIEHRKNLLRGRASPEAVEQFTFCRERIHYGGDAERRRRSILKRVRRLAATRSTRA